MTVTRVNPSGWGYRAILASAQMNQVDTNTTYTLDKRAGQSDTLSSAISVASGASITGLTGSTLTWNDSATFNSTVNLSLLSTTTMAGAFNASSISVMNLNGIVNTSLKESSDFTLELATRTSDAAIHNIFIKGQAPYASAVTNTSAGNVFVDLQGSLASSTFPAGFYIRDSLDVMLSVQRSANKLNNPSAASGVVLSTDVGIGMSINTSNNNSGPGLNAGGITIQPGIGSQLSGSVAILGGQATASGATPGHVTVQGGTGVNVAGSAGNASYVTLNGGTALNASNTAGAVNINGGSAILGSGSTGGSVNITGGQGTNNVFNSGSGHVYLTGGASYNFSGTASAPGGVFINGGASSTVSGSYGGLVTIAGGAGNAASGNAGDVVVSGGTASGAGSTGGNLFLTGGAGSGGKGNIFMGNSSGYSGGGQGIIWIATDNADPTSAPASGIILYVDASGNFKAKTQSGAVRVLAAV